MNFAKWKPTTGITAKERVRSSLRDLALNLSIGLGLPARRAERVVARALDIPKGLGGFNTSVTLNWNSEGSIGLSEFSSRRVYQLGGDGKPI
jgi:hypothetical protein